MLIVPFPVIARGSASGIDARNVPGLLHRKSEASWLTARAYVPDVCFHSSVSVIASTIGLIAAGSALFAHSAHMLCHSVSPEHWSWVAAILIHS